MTFDSGDPGAAGRAVSGADQPRTVEIHHDYVNRPLALEVHPSNDRYVSEEIVATGQWEPFETELVLRLLPPVGLLADCGANIGWYSVAAGAAGHRVIAVEPEPGNLVLLHRNVARNGLSEQVEVHQCALGVQPGRGTLGLSIDNQGDHRLSVAPGGRTVPIELRRLDDIVADRHIDVIKIDTQGSETGVLRGSRRALQAQNVCSTSIILEYWPFGLQDCGSSAEELIGLLVPIVDVTHACFEIDEPNRLLRPTSLVELALMAQAGDYSPEAQGHTNLLVVPKNSIHHIADLVAGPLCTAESLPNSSGPGPADSGRGVKRILGRFIGIRAARTTK